MRAVTETLSTQDGPMKLHEVRPETSSDAPRSAVIVIQEGFGVDAYIQSVARRYAEAGHLAVAPHLFHRTGDPELGYDDPTLAFPHIRALTQEGLLTDIAATLGRIEESGIPATRVGVVGFSMGGSVVMALGAALELGAGVSFCGGGGGGLSQARLFGLPPLIEVAKGFRTPWLGHFGDLDEYIPVDEVERLRTAAALSPVHTEVVRYAEAGHDFYCDARPEHLHEKSAAEAWRLTDEFLNRRLKR
ncbi:dienelactone hydrolase family protein [Streptomyces sp. NPDC048473]|uniref:dienelactone hydrolase family protein n=1 Tax=unclassified Streptomyces TaxID=2593676 RepID=UPI00371141C1